MAIFNTDTQQYQHYTKVHQTSLLALADGSLIATENPLPTENQVSGLDIAKGLIPNTSYIHKFGANFGVDGTSAPESIWSAGGLYPWDAWDGAAKSIYVKSDDSNDTGTLQVQGLDANYVEIFETVTLTGTSAVQLSNTFKRIFRMEYSGTTPNEGTITAHLNSASGTVVSQIEEDDGQTLQTPYTIPAGYDGYLIALDFSVQKGKDAQMRLYNREFGSSFRLKHLSEVHESTYRYDFFVPIKFEEKSDIDVRVYDVENNNTRIMCNYTMVLRNNNSS